MKKALTRHEIENSDIFKSISSQELTARFAIFDTRKGDLELLWGCHISFQPFTDLSSLRPDQIGLSVRDGDTVKMVVISPFPIPEIFKDENK